MALKDRLSDTPKKQSGHPCSVGALLEKLDSDEHAALNAMLYDLGWSGTKIHAALSAEGYEVGKQTVNRHRSRACRCFA